MPASLHPVTVAPSNAPIRRTSEHSRVSSRLLMGTPGHGGVPTLFQCRRIDWHRSHDHQTLALGSISLVRGCRARVLVPVSAVPLLPREVRLCACSPLPLGTGHTCRDDWRPFVEDVIIENCTALSHRKFPGTRGTRALDPAKQAHTLGHA